MKDLKKHIYLFSIILAFAILSMALFIKNVGEGSDLNSEPSSLTYRELPTIDINYTNYKSLNKIGVLSEHKPDIIHTSMSNYNKEKETVTVIATAYDALCDPVTINGVRYSGCSGITSGGTNVKNTLYHEDGYRIVAADWDYYPKGTLLKIEGFDEVFIVDDKGGAIKGKYRIDVLMRSKEKANQFGVQELEITILERGDV